jgi:polyisoprenoid-binding protein YceI
MTIKGISRPVSAKGTWQGDTPHAFGGERAVQLEATVDRTEFALELECPLPTGGQALEKDVTLNIDLILVKEP